MSASDFFKPVQSPPTSSGIRTNHPSGKKQIERQQLLADLKNQVQSNEYNVDLLQLSSRLRESGVLNNE